MKHLTDLLERAVADRVAPGLVAATPQPDGQTLVTSAGIRGLDSPIAMTPGTIFYIASCPKAVTSVAALQLVERGLVDLDEPVGRLLPSLDRQEVLTGFDATTGADI